MQDQIINQRLNLLNKSPDLWYWANIYKVSFAIFAALDLAVFEQLKQGAQNASKLAQVLDLQEDKLKMILDLFVKVGILDKVENESYSLSAKNSKQLDLIRMEHFFADHCVLPNNIRESLKGEYKNPPLDELMKRPGFSKMYYQAMQISTTTIAPFVVRMSRHQRERKILDIGGGDGNLLRQLAAYFGKEAIYTVYDKFGTGDSRQCQDAEYIHFVSGDVLDTALLSKLMHTHNIFIVSNLLHLLKPEDQKKLLRFMFNHMIEGNSLFVYDQFLEESHSEGGTVDFMQIDWILGEANFSFSGDQFASLLRRLGFSKISIKASTYFPGKLFHIEK